MGERETRLQAALRRAKEGRGCAGWDSRILEVVRAAKAEERAKMEKLMDRLVALSDRAITRAARPAGTTTEGT